MSLRKNINQVTQKQVNVKNSRDLSSFESKNKAITTFCFAFFFGHKLRIDRSSSHERYREKKLRLNRFNTWNKLATLTFLAKNLFSAVKVYGCFT